MGPVRGLLHRLSRQPHMVVDVFAGQPLQMRRLHLQPVPDLIQPPRQRRHPGEPRFDQHQPHAWHPLKHPLNHHGGQKRLAGLRMANHVLDIIGRPAATADRITAKAERVHTHGQPRSRGGLIDLPVALLARRLTGAAEHQHLHEMRIGGIPLDLRHRRIRILVRHDDRALQPGLRNQPFMQLPFVHRVTDGGAEFAVLKALAVVAGGVQDAQHTVVGVQQLLPQKRQRAAGPAVRRPRIAAGGIGLALRIRRSGLIGLPRAGAEHLHMLDPALLQIGVQILVAVALRMNVAIRRRQLRLVGRLRQRRLGNLDVHRTISFA